MFGSNSSSTTAITIADIATTITSVTFLLLSLPVLLASSSSLKENVEKRACIDLCSLPLGLCGGISVRLFWSLEGKTVAC